MANKSNVKKVVIVGAIVIVTGVAVWKIVKTIRERSEDKRLREEIESHQSSSQSASTSTSVTKPATKFDADKVLRPGSPSSQELKAAKAIFNKVIESARQLTPESGLLPSIGLSSDKESRRKAVAALQLLDTTTEYGAGTKKVAQTILGVTDFTYNRAKAQHIQWAKAYGLPSPY